MHAYSRREFGQVLFAGVPLSLWMGSQALAAPGDVTLGASTYSFRDLLRVPGQDNIDDVIRALKSVGITHVELASENAEPAGPNSGPGAKPRPQAYPPKIVVLTPAQIAAARAVVRADLRQWRLATPAPHFEQLRGKFAAAGISVHAYALEYDDLFTDAEIEATFRQAEALGAPVVSSPMTMAIARRLVPFAEKHRMTVAVHNQATGNPQGAITAAQFADALALSDCFRLKLDIGHLTASNRDAVADLTTYQATVTHVQIQDRLRNNGRSERFGDGDTPIAGVLKLIKDKHPAIPAFLEYDYVGQQSPAEEVAHCLEYMKHALSI